MDIFIAFVIGVFMGVLLCLLIRKKDGRLIISGDDYFVAISTPPKDLEKRKTINLSVIVREKDTRARF